MLDQAVKPLPVQTPAQLTAALSSLAGPPDLALAAHHAVYADKPFVDTAFPAAAATLAGTLDEATIARVQWKRLSELCSSEQLAIFSAPLDASDMVQGRLGDCWLLASVAALAQRAPQRLIQVFLTREVNRVGMFTVQLYVGLEMTRVTIDDMVPCLKEGSEWKPVFARSRQPEEMYVTMTTAHSCYYLDISCHIVSLAA